MVISNSVVIIDGDNYPSTGGAPPAKSHSGANTNHQPAENSSKHQGESKRDWLLALEIVTGTMVGVLFLVAAFTALQKCKTKTSIIIPWKKSASERDHMAVYIGQILTSDNSLF